MLATFYRPEGRRRKILATAVDFPTDIYAMQSQIRLRGSDPSTDLVRVPPRDDRFIHEDDVLAAMTDDVALVVLPSVLYHTGQLLDVARLAGAAHDAGIPLGIDAAHGVGCVPHHFEDWGVDFAVWCTYKYLNAGPAAPAALYVHPRHLDRMPGLAGWWGSDKARQFDMAHAFTPAADAGRWQISAPSALAMAGLEAALEVFADVDIEAVRVASLARTDYVIDLCDALGLTSSAYGFTIGTPRDHARRGGHVALVHPEAARITKALKARGIVPDHRPPDIIRLAPVALYSTFVECWRVVRALREIVERGEYERFSAGRDLVA
jgi:kynureninase